MCCHNHLKVNPLFPVLIAGVAFLGAQMSGAHICIDELTSFFQVWLVLSQGAFEHVSFLRWVLSLRS